MRNHRLEKTGFDKTQHQIDRTASNPQVSNQTFRLTLLEHLDRTTRLHSLREINMRRIVEIDQLQLLQTQQAQTALNADPHLRAAKNTALEIAVGLCRQHIAR